VPAPTHKLRARRRGAPERPAGSLDRRVTMVNGRTAVAMCVLALTAGGCRFDTTLDATGGGTMKIAYRLGKDGALDRAKKSFESPNIKIGNATIDKDKNVTI